MTWFLMLLLLSLPTPAQSNGKRTTNEIADWVRDNTPKTWSRKAVTRVSKGAVALTKERIRAYTHRSGSAIKALGDADMQAIMSLERDLHGALKTLAAAVPYCHEPPCAFRRLKGAKGVMTTHCEGGPCLVEDYSWMLAQLRDALPAPLRFFYGLPRPDTWLGFDHELMKERLGVPAALLKAVEARVAGGHPPLPPWLEATIARQASGYLEELMEVANRVCGGLEPSVSLSGSGREQRYCTKMQRAQRKAIKRAMSRPALKAYRGRFRAVLTYEPQECQAPNRTEVVQLTGYDMESENGSWGAQLLSRGNSEHLRPEGISIADLKAEIGGHPFNPYSPKEVGGFLDLFAWDKSTFGWIVSRFVGDALKALARSKAPSELMVTVCRSPKAPTAFGDSGRAMPFAIDGPIRILWPDGSLFFDTQHPRGIWSGPWHQWRQDGTLQATGKAKRGEPHGKELGYHPSGARAYEKYVKAENELHGVSTEWHPNGVVASRTPFKQGDEQGVARTWAENGKQISQISYEKGLKSGPMTLWHPNGKKHVQVKNRKGAHHGKMTLWHPNGKRAASGKCHEGRRVGAWTWWDRDGVRWAKGRFAATAKTSGRHRHADRRDTWAVLDAPAEGFKCWHADGKPSGSCPTWLPSKYESLRKRGSGERCEQTLHQRVSGSKSSVIKVSTFREFLEAVGSKRTIEVKPGTYLMSGVPPFKSSHVEWDGDSLVIRQVQDLVIWAGKGKQVRFISPHPFATVLILEATSRVTLRGLTLGHEPATAGGCDGDVLVLDRSSEIRLEKMTLFGSGVVGLVLESSRNVTFSEGTIYGCTGNAVSLRSSSGLHLVDSQIRDNMGWNLFWVGSGSRDLIIERCELRRNKMDNALIYMEDAARIGPALRAGYNIRLHDTTIRENEAKKFYTKETGKLRVQHGNVDLLYEGTTFRANRWTYPPPEEQGLDCTE